MPSIKDQIKQGNISGAYLLYGEEDFLKDHYCQKITELATQDGPKEFNYMKINNDKIDNGAVTEFIISLPFMSDKKVLYLKNTGIFHKATESDKKFWTDIFDTLPEYMVVIFSESNIDKRGTLYKAISKSHTAEEFALCKEAELINWFANILARFKKSMTKEDISFVIENVGRNMYLLKSEAEKLIAFTGEKEGLIKREDVEKCICKSLEGKVFAMIDHIISKDSARAIDELNELKTLKEQPVKILSLIFRQFSTLRRIKALEGASVVEIAQRTNQRDFIVKKIVSQTKKFSLKELDDAIFLCNKTDKNIKSGAVEPWLSIEQLVVTLMNS